jgi:uncharacterized protein YdeI (YjbR/CyaY-like superfamily)
MKKTSPKVDAYLSKLDRWQDETRELRRIILDCQLTEELKWRQPCYTLRKSNVVIIQGFKDYCAAMFFKGALLRDSEGILVKPGTHTQAGRQMRFASVQEVLENEATLRAYIKEAIEVEEAGLEVELKGTSEYEIPDEFQAKLDEIPALKTAFEALTPGRQRAYILYFAGAKQAKTRESRVAKHMQRILEGKGLNDP